MVRKYVNIGVPLGVDMLLSFNKLILNNNNNNKVIIVTPEKLKGKYIHYVLCGVGNMESELKTLTQ